MGIKIIAAIFTLASLALLVFIIKKYGWSWWIPGLVLLYALAVALIIGIDPGAGFP